MDIRDLDYFLACCKAGSFTAAARDAHIVQPAMSGAIARQERDLGAQLVDRGVMPVALTEHGAARRHPDVVIKLRQSKDGSAGAPATGRRRVNGYRPMGLAPPKMSPISRRVESLSVICLT